MQYLYPLYYNSIKDTPVKIGWEKDTPGIGYVLTSFIPVITPPPHNSFDRSLPPPYQKKVLEKVLLCIYISSVLVLRQQRAL